MKGRVIPQHTMSRIYADMFIADQWLKDNSKVRATADTCDFYGPIFKKYGYSFKDYNKSVEHYLNNAQKFNSILEESTSILTKELDALKDEQTLREQIRELENYLKKYAPTKIDFARDTLLWKPDSLKRKPEKLVIVKDSLYAQRRDSIRTDILAPPRKFLRGKPFALKREDMQF